MHTSRHRSGDDFDEFGYNIAFVHGQQGTGRKRRVLVAWKDFSFRDDTWELAEDVYPKAKLLKYENALASVHVLGEPLQDVRIKFGLAGCILLATVTSGLPWQSKTVIPNRAG